MNRYFYHVLLLASLSWHVYADGKADSWNFKVYLDDQPVGFHNFTIDGEPNERNDLWYSPDQRWLALDSTLENGRVIHYRME